MAGGSVIHLSLGQPATSSPFNSLQLQRNAVGLALAAEDGMTITHFPGTNGLATSTLRSGKLGAEILRQNALSTEVREEMWRLFRRYYESLSHETFLSDLSKKHHVILMRDTGDGSVRGFSTIFTFDQEVEGKRVIAIFSGDTIIDDAYWGQSALQYAFFRYILTQKLENPLTPLYWFLISKGFRTYLLLSRNFPNYWPRHDAPTPTREANILDALAKALYPEEWRSNLGVLQFKECAGKLKRGVAPIDRDMLAHADINFFVNKNPGHADGDELCCLGKVDAVLLLTSPFRLVAKGIRSLLGSRPRSALDSRSNARTP